MNKRPYESLHDRAERAGESVRKTVNWIVVMVLLAAVVVISLMIYGILTRPAIALTTQSVVRLDDRAEIEQRLKDRKMPLATPVEITNTQHRYRFWLNGKWERL